MSEKLNPEWISVEDGTPKKDDAELVYLGSTELTTLVDFGNTEFEIEIDYVTACPEHDIELFSKNDGDVTHWAYIPNPLIKDK